MQHYTVYLFLENCSTCLGGISTHHQKHIELYLQYLVLVKPLLLTAAIVLICFGAVALHQSNQYNSHTTLKPVPTLPQ